MISCNWRFPTDKVDEEYLLKPRKWNIDSVKKFMMYIGPISSIFDYATFGLMWFVYRCSEHSAPGDYHGAFVSDGVVRGIAADADADCAHHPDEPDTVHPEFAELAVVPGDADYHGHRRLPALLAGDGAFPGIGAAAGVVVGVDGIVFAFVLGPLPSCEGVVPEEIRNGLTGC